MASVQASGPRPDDLLDHALRKLAQLVEEVHPGGAAAEVAERRQRNPCRFHPQRRRLRGVAEVCAARPIRPIWFATRSPPGRRMPISIEGMTLLLRRFIPAASTSG